MDDSLRTAVDRVGNELFNIVHSDEGGLDSVTLAASERNRGALEAGLEPARPSPQGEGRVTEVSPRTTSENEV